MKLHDALLASLIEQGRLLNSFYEESLEFSISVTGGAVIEWPASFKVNLADNFDLVGEFVFDDDSEVWVFDLTETD